MEQATCTITMTCNELNAIEAKSHAAGKLEAAQHILELWRQPWGVAGRPFIKLLEAYVEELK